MLAYELNCEKYDLKLVEFVKKLLIYMKKC